MNIVQQSQFDVTNLNFKTLLEFQDFKQHMISFNYKFGSNVNDAIILTDPIKMTGNCIPTVDMHFKINDNQCMHFWINCDEPDGKLLMTQVIDKIDQKFVHLDGNNNSNINFQGKKFNKLRYIKCHHTYGEFEDAEGNFHDMNRIKVHLDTKFNSNQNETKKIKTKVFLPINKNVQINEIEFTEPEIITSLDNLRSVFHQGCTVRFVLKLHKFWVQKNIDQFTKLRNCGVTIKCMQIYVMHDPVWFQFDQSKPVIMPGIKIANTKVNVTNKYEFDNEEEQIITYNPEKSIYEFDEDDENFENKAKFYSQKKKHIKKENTIYI